MRLRLALLASSTLVITLLSACRLDRRAASDVEERAVVDTITRMVKRAYDFSSPDVVDRLLALYPDTGRVVSAAGGQVTTARDTLAAGIRSFWARVGQNMRDPRTEWGPIHVDVPSSRVAIATARYTIPHTTPQGTPHVIGGAMTLVFVRHGDQWRVTHEHLSDIPQAVLNPTAPAAP